MVVERVVCGELAVIDVRDVRGPGASLLGKGFELCCAPGFAPVPMIAEDLAGARMYDVWHVVSKGARCDVGKTTCAAGAASTGTLSHSPDAAHGDSQASDCSSGSSKGDCQASGTGPCDAYLIPVCIIRRAARRRLDVPMPTSRAGDVRLHTTTSRARGLPLSSCSILGAKQANTLQELVAAATERRPSIDDVEDDDEQEEEEDEQEDEYITIDGDNDGDGSTAGYDSRLPVWSAAPVPVPTAQAESENPLSPEDYHAKIERDRVTSASRHLPLFMQEWLVRQTVPRGSASQDAIERSEGWVRSAAQASSIFSAVLTPEDEDADEHS
jgi:hypothetical protein